ICAHVLGDDVVELDQPILDLDAVVLGVELIADFIAAIGTGKRPETVNSDNIRSLAMVFGEIERAKTGRRVEISA
ncbi:gfo/Idh/MocA family oxidoreductase, partial [Rhizobium leguminosarum]